ncbi:MAG: hypothetical protein AB7U29_15895 [Desulfobulbus sp.]
MLLICPYLLRLTFRDCYGADALVDRYSLTLGQVAGALNEHSRLILT